MTHPILTEIRFSELRHLDTPANDPRRGTILGALKVAFLIFAAIVAAFGIFYELVMLSLALDISAWWAGALYLALYAWWLRKAWKGAMRA